MTHPKFQGEFQDPLKISRWISRPTQNFKVNFKTHPKFQKKIRDPTKISKNISWSTQIKLEFFMTHPDNMEAHKHIYSLKPRFHNAT